MIGQNEILKHETQIIQDDIDTKHGLTASYRKEQKDLIETRHQMNHLKEQNKHADRLPEYDDEGNVKMTLREQLKPEIEPTQHAIVKKLKGEQDELLAYLVKQSGRLSSQQWHNALQYEHRRPNAIENVAIDSLNGKINWKSKYFNQTYKSFAELRDYYEKIGAEYINAMNRAQQELKDAKKFNEELKQNMVIETKPVSRDMLAELRLQRADQDRTVEAIKNEIQEKRQLAQEVEKLQREISQIEKDISKMSASVDVSAELEALAQKKAELNELLKQKAEKNEESEYHEKLQQRTRDVARKVDEEKAYQATLTPTDNTEAVQNYATAQRNLDHTSKELDYQKNNEQLLHNLRKETDGKILQNAIKEKELENMKEKQGEFDALTSELVANEAQTSAQKRLIGLQEQTFKAEHDARTAKAHLNEVQSETYQKSEQDIADAQAKLETTRAEVKRMETFLNQQRQLQTAVAEKKVREQMAQVHGDSPGFDAWETAVAAQKELTKTMKEQADREALVDGVIKEMRSDSSILEALNAYGEETVNGFHPYDDVEDVANARNYFIGNDGWGFISNFKTKYWA